MDIKESILNYKEITVKIIDAIDKEKYEDLTLFVDKREEIIEKLKKININKEHFKELCDEINLIQLENNLNKLLISKRNDIKFKLDAIAKNIQASSSYNKITDSPLIFSKKI